MRDLLAELLALRLELLERVGQAVRDLHVAAVQLAHQLDVVVAGHGQRDAVARPSASPGAACRECAAPGRRGRRGRWPCDLSGWLRPRPVAVGLDPPAERRQQLDQLVVAAVDVADDVERAVLVLAVVPERLALDRRRVDLLERAQHVDVSGSLRA